MMYGLLLLALLGYILPWIVAPTAAMTLNAFDLAEWTSLHPMQRQASVPILVPLLLRMQLPIIGILIVLVTKGSRVKLIGILAVALMSLAQLPPPEFLRNTADPNYQQQFALAALTVAAATAGSLFLSARVLPYFVIIVSIAGAGTSIFGQAQAGELLQLSLQEGKPGAGLWLSVIAYAGFVLAAISNLRQRS